MFDDKTLLITGGTGSFGNAVLRRFLDSGLREIRIFSRDEKKQDDMRKRYNSAGLKFYLGDVRDERSVGPAMRGVDRSEEHTSELQSLMRISYAVFCLKKKKTTYNK